MSAIDKITNQVADIPLGTLDAVPEVNMLT